MVRQTMGTNEDESDKTPASCAGKEATLYSTQLRDYGQPDLGFSPNVFYNKHYK